ncbi:MAG: hypothetical protein GF400_04255 [Candidatus Eisenbacteria bacterium]|nr:hypothetical protein [Candidatus Eisenbacteria bacterium]
MARVEADSTSPVDASDCGISEPGQQILCWDGTTNDGRAVSSGVYLVRLLFDGQVVRGQQIRLTLVR